MLKLLLRSCQSINRQVEQMEHYTKWRCYALQPRDGAGSQQAAVACVRCFQKESLCCEGQLSEGGGNGGSLFEQRENVGFCQKLDKSSREKYQMIKQAHCEEASGCSAVCKWHNCVAQERDSLEDDDHTGRPKTVRTELKIQGVTSSVHANRSQTVHEVAAAGISRGTCHRGCPEHVSCHPAQCSARPDARSKWRSHEHLSWPDRQCWQRWDVPQPDRNGTRNEVFSVDPQLKRQSATWRSPSSPSK
jgi:hypothetical protein